MARIAGIDIPDSKRIVISLTYIHGIGDVKSREILKKVGIDEDIRVKNLNEGQVASIRNAMDKMQIMVEGELRRVVSQNIKRLKDIGSYRGSRHARGLPARGQKTQKNARTKRGKRTAVGGANPRSAAKT